MIGHLECNTGSRVHSTSFGSRKAVDSSVKARGARCKAQDAARRHTQAHAGTRRQLAFRKAEGQVKAGLVSREVVVCLLVPSLTQELLPCQRDMVNRGLPAFSMQLEEETAHRNRETDLGKSKRN